MLPVGAYPQVCLHPVATMSFKILLPGMLLLLLAASIGGCYSHLRPEQAPAPKGATYGPGRVIENLVYTPPNWPQPLAADLYLPRREGPVPVVLVVHGGGWSGRHRDDMDGISRKLNRHGFAAFNVSYRFAPEYNYPAQLHDLRQALAWLQNNASRFGLDRDRISTWGFSSGAHLAALVASIDHQTMNSAVDDGELPAIRAVVAGGIPSDLRKYNASPLVMGFMGGDNHEMPERYADASPAFHISSDDPPVFLYHGKFDFLVTEDQAVDYFVALRAAGVYAELYLHRWLGHSTLFLFGGSAEDKAIEFLERNNAPDRAIAKGS